MKNSRTFGFDFKDTRQLLLLFALATCLWGFVELAETVMAGGTSSVDEALLLMLRNDADLTDPIGPMWVEEMMRDITALGSVGVLTLVTLLAVGFLLLEHKRRLALLVIVAIGSGMLASFFLKYGFSRPRPDLVPHGSYTYTSSFPSGHSMLSALVYFTLASLLAQVQYKKRIKAYLYTIAIILTVMIGISRVYLGVHWPTDVLAGWVAGIFWALIFLLVTKRLQKQGKIEHQGVEPELQEAEVQVSAQPQL
ncbi:MAG: undecaprenyl-diphosphatase [Paraglaciecola sp.]|jgi:undecaprenyl-diphosphatase